jgi:hypothetical protein
MAYPSLDIEDLRDPVFTFNIDPANCTDLLDPTPIQDQAEEDLLEFLAFNFELDLDTAQDPLALWLALGKQTNADSTLAATGLSYELWSKGDCACSVAESPEVTSKSKKMASVRHSSHRVSSNKRMKQDIPAREAVAGHAQSCESAAVVDRHFQAQGGILLQWCPASRKDSLLISLSRESSLDEDGMFGHAIKLWYPCDCGAYHEVASKKREVYGNWRFGTQEGRFEGFLSMEQVEAKLTTCVKDMWSVPKAWFQKCPCRV